jgi:ribosomal protein S18 acetylase RimI-like enzyme
MKHAPALAALRAAVAEHLTSRHGNGPWSSPGTVKGVLYAMRNSSVYVALDRGEVLATLTLCAKKPWAIDRKYFTVCRKPLYLTGMAVDPKRQRRGIGRRCMNEVQRIAKEWPSDAIRLDSYDAVAGAGEFYEKCGFRKVGRASYRNCPLIYFEMLL